MPRTLTETLAFVLCGLLGPVLLATAVHRSGWALAAYAAACALLLASGGQRARR